MLRALLHPSVPPKASAASSRLWEDRGHRQGLLRSTPKLTGLSQPGAGNREGSTSVQLAPSKSWHSQLLQKPGYAPAKKRNMEAVQDTLESQKGRVWFNCLQRTHTFCQSPAFSLPKYFFLFIIFLDLASGSGLDAIMARSSTVPWTTDHHGQIHKALVPNVGSWVGP